MRNETYQLLEKDGFRFYAASCLDRGKTVSTLPDLDQILFSGAMVKNSRTTAAAVVSVPFLPDKVFLKRTNTKSFTFVLKYLFRPSRVFRAAKAALRLAEAGITTPRMWAWGEQRKAMRILTGGYQIMEYLPGAFELEKVITEQNAAEVIGKAAAILGAMHTAGVFHGDAKLPNFYRDNGKYGVWDLDGSLLYPANGVPREKRLEDLGRLAFSCREFKIPLSDEEICTVIGEHYPPEAKICRHCVAAAMQRRSGKKH